MEPPDLFVTKGGILNSDMRTERNYSDLTRYIGPLEYMTVILGT